MNFDWIVIITVLIIVIVGVLIYFNSIRQISFNREITVNVSPEILWTEFMAVFSDSGKTDFWPHDLQQIKADKIESGEIFKVTYKILETENTYSYKFKRIVPNRLISYKTTENHPMSGAGKIEIFPAEQGAKFVWTGRYENKRFSLAPEIFKLYFENKFFSRLKENLQNRF